MRSQRRLTGLLVMFTVLVGGLVGFTVWYVVKRRQRHLPVWRTDPNPAYLPPVSLANELPIVCLNLPYRKEKWKQLKQSLDVQGFSQPFRYSAVVGRDLKLDDFDDPAFVHPTFYKHLKKTPKHMGHLGCLLSHIGIYELVADNHWDTTVVLEDDALLDSRFRELLGDRLARVNEVDPEWDLLVLGCSCDYRSYEKCHRNDHTQVEWSFIVPMSYFMGTWGYVIHGRRAAQKLLKFLLPVTWCIDHHLCSMIEQKKLRVYGTLPALAFHPGDWSISSWGYRYKKPYSGYRSDTNG